MNTNLKISCFHRDIPCPLYFTQPNVCHNLCFPYLWLKYTIFWVQSEAQGAVNNFSTFTLLHASRKKNQVLQTQRNHVICAASTLWSKLIYSASQYFGKSLKCVLVIIKPNPLSAGMQQSRVSSHCHLQDWTRPEGKFLLLQCVLLFAGSGSWLIWHSFGYGDFSLHLFLPFHGV